MARHNIRLYSSDGFQLKHIPRSEYNRLGREQRIRDVVYNGKFWGAQLLSAFEAKPRRRGAPVITLTEVMRNAGLHDYDRAHPCPATRAAQDKINAWPAEFDKRAPIVSAGVAHGIVAGVEIPEYLASCSWPKWDAPHDLLQRLRAIGT